MKEKKEEKELESHVRAIGQWASEDRRRVAFVVCGEISEDGIETSNSLVGRTDRIARALVANAKKHDPSGTVIRLASEAMDNSVAARQLTASASKDDCEDWESGCEDADVLKELADIITRSICNDD